MTSLYERLIAAAYLVEQFEALDVSIAVNATNYREAIDVHVTSTDGAADVVDAILAECDDARAAEWTWRDSLDWPWKYEGVGFIGDFRFTVLCLASFNDAVADVKEASA